MRIVIISLAVKRANTDAPSAVLIPAECLHISALNRTDRRADAAEHIMPEMPPPIPVGARRAEIIVFRYGIALCNRRCGADAVLFFPHNFLSVFKCHRAIFAEHTRKHRIIGAAIIKVKLFAAAALRNVGKRATLRLGFFRKRAKRPRAVCSKASAVHCRITCKQFRPGQALARFVRRNIKRCRFLQRLCRYGEIHPTNRFFFRL